MSSESASGPSPLPSPQQGEGEKGRTSPQRGEGEKGRTSPQREEGGAARLIDTALNPIPPGADCVWARAKDGVRLRVAYWPGGERGTIVILQGRTEYIEKYFETIGELRARGFGVLAFDWRGQGGSDRLLRNPLKGHVDDFAQFLWDLDATAEIAGARCPKPWSVLAHSMGGLIALDALRQRPGLFARATVTSPMTRIRLRQPGAIAFAAQLLPRSAFVPGGARFDPAMEPFERNPVTHDRARFLRNRGVLEVCPSLGLGSPTYGWLRAAFAAMKRIDAPRFLSKIETPILMLSAGEDQIIDSRSHLSVARALKACAHLKIRGARHEIMMETDDLRAEFWRAFDGFVPG